MEMNTDTAIQMRIEQIAALAHLIPAPIIIHGLPDFKVLYISDSGLQLLGVTHREVEGLSVEDYQKRFFNPEDTKNYVPKMMAMINGNTNETVSYFHQVRTSKTRDWDWYLGLTRILMRDETN